MSRRHAAADLSERDLAIFHFLSDASLATAQQLERLVFPATEFGSGLSAARRCRRVLARLTEHGYLGRLDRRVGGVRAGSAGYVYQLGTLGLRALGGTGRGRTWEPGGRYVAHTLATTELHVELLCLERSGQLADLSVLHEPATWRRFMSPSGLQTLKPDLLIELTTVEPAGADGWELRWFVEIDRGSEHLPTVLGKCQTYQRYWASGRETERHEVFPRVLWSVPTEGRATALRQALASSRSLSPELFVVAMASDTPQQLVKTQAVDPASSALETDA